jgi:hypothetical protein
MRQRNIEDHYSLPRQLVSVVSLSILTRQLLVIRFSVYGMKFNVLVPCDDLHVLHLCKRLKYES